MTELYLNEASKDEAKYKYSDELVNAVRMTNFTDESITAFPGISQEINRPKIIDLSELVGNTEILFEFSDDGKDWVEGYLISMGDTEHCFHKGEKINGELNYVDSYSQIRFQTDRWYFHDGKSECPLPEGVVFKLKVMNRDGGDPYVDDRNFFNSIGTSNDIWIHKRGNIKVMAYRVTGLLPEWEYK